MSLAVSQRKNTGGTVAIAENAQFDLLNSDIEATAKATIASATKGFR